MPRGNGTLRASIGPLGGLTTVRPGRQEVSVLGSHVTKKALSVAALMNLSPVIC